MFVLCNEIFLWDFSRGRMYHLLTLDLTFRKTGKKTLCVLTIFPRLLINIFFPDFKSAYSTKLVSVKNFSLTYLDLTFVKNTIEF